MAMQNDDVADAIAMNNNYKYDVFLSFNGQDTRLTFTGNLYHALRQKRIKTFFQNHEDESITTSSIDQIKESRISIVILSENYVTSTRCLDELVNIIDFMNTNKNLVWPIFYKVEAHMLKREIEDKFQRYSESYQKRMPKWNESLFQVSNLAGWSYVNEYEHEFIQKIVESAMQTLPRYDIFLSFCGEDTRYSFTRFLYHALRREGFKTFMDDEGLEGGNQISKTLLEAIDKSRLSIVVFSQNYGYSSWCLDEFVKIMECKKTNNQLVWPIFYKIEQSDVSNQTKSFGKAMTGHEDKYGKDSEKVQKWKSALSEVASLKGDHINANEYESEVIKKIVERAIEVENQL